MGAKDVRVLVAGKIYPIESETILIIALAERGCLRKTAASFAAVSLLDPPPAKFRAIDYHGRFRIH